MATNKLKYLLIKIPITNRIIIILKESVNINNKNKLEIVQDLQKEVKFDRT